MTQLESQEKKGNKLVLMERRCKSNVWLVYNAVH